MTINFNPHISVDCVVFGFDEAEGLKVLLVERSNILNDKNFEYKLKLPGDLIIKKEPLKKSAERILFNLTGIKDIFLKQYAVFDDPGRLSPKEDLEWLIAYSNTNIERVITIAFYSLVKLDLYSENEINGYKRKWFNVNEIPKLVFDHNLILHSGLDTLRREFLSEPLCFELLPKKFTLNQLQKVYEAIRGVKLDNRNFRKRINRLEYIIALNEYQTDVNHKPARFYVFDKEIFNKEIENEVGIIV